MASKQEHKDVALACSYTSTELVNWMVWENKAVGRVAAGLTS